MALDTVSIAFSCAVIGCCGHGENEARTVMRTKQGYSTEFEVKVGVHQGSVLSPLLFVAVMEVVTRGVKEELPWELLYADDLVLVSQSKEELREEGSAMEGVYGAKGPEGKY